MKNSSVLLYSAFLILNFVVLSGCRPPKSDSDLVRRARLTGQENLQLKKQLKRIEKENAAIQKELSKNRDCQRQLQQCRQDFADAPMPCPEVEAQYTQLLESLAMLLMECQQRLEKYEQPQEP